MDCLSPSRCHMASPLEEAHREEQYQLLSTIGVGAYGKAILALKKGSYISEEDESTQQEQHVVIKQILLRDEDDASRQEALKEAQLLSQFDHVNIIHYYDSFFVGQTLNIVMEYASEGTLADVIARRAAEKKPLSEDDIMFWFTQVVLALYHVHSKNILFRDLKSQNIFISKGNILKLGDFGIARVLTTDTELASTVIGTPYYLSPEVCEDKPYNRKSDVWALGCLLYELCTLRRAFNGQSLPALVVQILRGRYPPVPTRYSSPLRGLVEAMLQLNPKARPSVGSLLRNSYIRQHVERYAHHIMQLSPAAAPLPGMQPHASTAAPSLSPAPSLDEPKSAGSSSSRVRQSAGKLPPRPSNRGAAGVPSKPATSGPATPVKPGTPPRVPSPNVGAAPVGPTRSVLSPAEEFGTAGSTAQGAATDAPAHCTPPSSSQSGRVSSVPGQAAIIQGCTPAGASPSKSPQPGCSPMANRAARKYGHAQPGAGTWIRQQCAALAELEGALALQGAGRRHHGAAAVAAVDVPATAAADQDLPQPPDNRTAPTQQVEVADLRPQEEAREGAADVVTDAGAALQGKPALGRAAMASVARVQLQAARDAELQAARQAIIQERERKAKAVARRSQVLDKAQKQRMSEREQEAARARLEARAKEAESAARHAQRAAELKSKQEHKQQLQEQLLAHMAAHQQHMRAVKARVTRTQLEALGAVFAARQKESVAGVTEAAQGGDAGPRVLLVEAPAPIARVGSSNSSHHGPSKPGLGVCSPAGGRGQGRASVLQVASPSVSKIADKEHADQQKQEPPWRAARKAAGPAGAKDVPVEVFLPYARSPEPARPASPTTSPPRSSQPQTCNATASNACKPQQQQQQQQQRQSPAQAKGPSAGAVMSSGEKAKEQQDDTPWGSSELLGLLSEIQAVLLGSSDEEEGGDMGEGAGGSSGEEDRPREMGNKQSQPASGRVAQEDVASQRAVQQQAQQLRAALEQELGLQTFQATYKHVRALQQQEQQSGDGQGAGEHLLAAKPYLARQFMRLITLEDRALT